MKIKKGIIGTLSCLSIGAAFFTYSPINVGAIETKGVYGKESPELFKPDFARDKIGAEKWAKEFYKKWKDSVSSEQMKSSEELKAPFKPTEYDINQMLRITGGDLNRRPIDHPEKTERYKKDVNNIDKALSNKLGKTSNKMYVYKDIKLSDFNGMIDGSVTDLSHPNRVDMEKMKEFKNNFTYGISSDYLMVNLSETEGGDEGTLKWRIELPKGTNTGYLDEDRLVLQRNTGLIINNIKVINQKGKEYIRIEARLIEKDKIDESVRQTQATLNESWNKALELPTNTEFIKFEVHDRYASSVTEGARSMLHEMASNIPNNMIKDVIDFMAKNGGKIVFTDTDLPFLPEVYFPQSQTINTMEKYRDEQGIYNKYNYTLFFNGVANGPDGENGMSARNFTLAFGHAVDYFFGTQSESKPLSDTNKFKDIFKKEGEKLTDYGKSSEEKFFADAFMMMFSSDPEKRVEVEEKAPETVNFIRRALGDYVYPLREKEINGTKFYANPTHDTEKFIETIEHLKIPMTQEQAIKEHGSFLKNNESYLEEYKRQVESILGEKSLWTDVARLKNYTYESRDINNYLRTGDMGTSTEEYYKKNIASIKAILEALPAREGYVYRGLEDNGIGDFLQKNVGNTSAKLYVTDKAFISTTKDLNFLRSAGFYANVGTTNKNIIIYQIKNKSGKELIKDTLTSTTTDQSEVLFNTDSVFFVTGYTQLQENFTWAPGKDLNRRVTIIQLEEANPSFAQYRDMASGKIIYKK